MADLFVMPSTGEGFGIAFLEAMASGTPALGLDVAGGAATPWPTASSALLVSDEDDLPAAIARHLSRTQARPGRSVRGGTRPLRPAGIPRAGRACALRSAFANRHDRARVAPTRHLLVLEAGRAERHYWRDLWAYRELFAILAWRDVAVRYKQTVIGVAWAVVRPFLTMVVFTVVFGRLAKLPSDGGAPYPVMVFAGMLPWFLFSTILSEASNSLVGNANLIGKVYFPRLIIPASSAVVALVDFAINLAILVRADGLVRLLRRAGRSCCCPPSSLLALLASLGPALVDHRAQRQIPRLPLHHPVHRAVRPLRLAGRVFERRSCRSDWRFWYSLNPMVGVIDGFRWCMLGGESQLYLPGFLLSLGVVALFLWLGIAYFRRTERSFADLI